MLKILILSVILSENVFSLLINPTFNETFIHNIFKYDELIDLTVNKTVMHILDFEEDSDILSVYPTRVHVGTNDSISVDYPLLVTASQQKGISSWDLPLVINTKNKVLHFNDMARTLCPHDAGPNITAQGRPSMTLSTSSPNNVTVKIKVRRVQDFYLEVNKEVTLNVTPSTPKYYYFSFDRDPLNLPHSQHSHLLFPKFNYTIPKSVLLTIDSDDDVCAVVSIQSNSCPVFDNERDVTYRGYHFTMTRKGGITVTQSMFPRGFYVVFIVKESDEQCSGVAARARDRRKTFRFSAEASVTPAEYAAGALAALALVLLVALLAPLAHALSCAAHETITIIENEPVPSSSRDAPAVAEVTPIVSRHTDDFESEVESEAEPEVEAEAAPLTVAGLSRARPQAHSRRSNRYFTSSLTVAVVYALPVVQLLATYQARVRQSGDQDVCYYNFQCALPLGPLSDSNHVASNAGYVLLGAAFMLQVRWRQARRARRARAPDRRDVGIPEHPGLLYSMGLALVMEGVLSACYHLCPNKMNFQFDSSFMYVTAVLCMVKLYQSRHPDVNASANTTFLLLAFVMAIGVVGIMDPSLYFWALFTVAHLAVCFFLTFKIYYVGKLKMRASLARRAWARAAAGRRQRLQLGARRLRAVRAQRGLRAAPAGRAAGQHAAARRVLRGAEAAARRAPGARGVAVAGAGAGRVGRRRRLLPRLAHQVVGDGGALAHAQRAVRRAARVRLARPVAPRLRRRHLLLLQLAAHHRRPPRRHPEASHTRLLDPPTLSLRYPPPASHTRVLKPPLSPLRHPPASHSHLLDYSPSPLLHPRHLIPVV